MNKIDELIKELCPNGVEWKKLGEVAQVSIGEFVHQNKQNPNGLYPVYNGGITNTGFYDQFNNTANKIIISARGANAGFVNKIEVPYWAGNSCYSINVDQAKANWFFVFYYLSGKQSDFMGQQQKGGIPAVSKKQVLDFEIPLPPLAIQEEIVRILDKFVEQQEQLEKLIELRKKQYEYYREVLLTPKEGEEWKVIPIRELGSITRGRRFVRDDVRESGMPCIHYGDMYTYYGITAKTTKTFLDRNFPKKMQFAKNGDVVVVGAGENDLDIGVGTVWEGDEPAAVHDACYILEHMQNPKYIAYFLRTNNYHRQIRKFVSEGKICSISGTGLGSCFIPLPSLAKQQEIVDFLDRFEANISVMKSALVASKKRYEHYREELLKF